MCLIWITQYSSREWLINLEIEVLKFRSTQWVIHFFFLISPQVNFGRKWTSDHVLQSKYVLFIIFKTFKWIGKVGKEDLISGNLSSILVEILEGNLKGSILSFWFNTCLGTYTALAANRFYFKENEFYFSIHQEYNVFW